MRLARWTALASYVALLLLVFFWETWWASLTPLPRAFWIAVKVTPLMFPLPGLWRKSARAHVLASLLLLVYFCEGVAAVYSTPASGNDLTIWYGSAEIILVVLAITAASMFARFAFKSLPSQTRARKVS